MVPLIPRSLIWSAVFIFVLLWTLVSARDDGYVEAKINGVNYLVRDNRQPSLYTMDFGSCMSDSTFVVDRLDAALYKDNMTILFNLDGVTTLDNITTRMLITVYAYGEDHFDLLVDPCGTTVGNLCPVDAGVRLGSHAVIPLGQSDVVGIPPMAFDIPDFEGQAIFRIFSNSDQSEIACFAATLTNGNSFSNPEWVSSILGIFTFVAIISSFATAIYGDSIGEARRHYAHSTSVLLVFSVWQHIYFSGALSMNWPSVLPAFWSNYAWAGGMIYTEAMQSTIDSFVGPGKGNLGMLGAAMNNAENPGLGGGYNIRKVYARDSSNWHGGTVNQGLPLPGNYSGFAGTLSSTKIPASNAFMTGFLWFLVLVAIVAASIIILKLLVELLVKARALKHNRLTYFRAHYLAFTGLAVLRTLYTGFFVLMFLTLFQFSYQTSTPPLAVACIVFLSTLVSLVSLLGYACFYRIKTGKYTIERDRLLVVRRKALKLIPYYALERASKFPRSEDKTYAGSLPWWRMCSTNEGKSIHDDETFTKKFGWLASRFRRNRWWFFNIWLLYEFVRACFLAGAISQPMVQVFGLLVVEIIAFIGIVILRPFEGQRLNVLLVYFLGFSKIATLALSVPLAARFQLERIPATVFGIVIIIVQGVLTIATLIVILLGAATSYMSVMRNRETISPKRWIPIREKYFRHMDFRAKGIPKPKPLPKKPKIKPTEVPVEDIPTKPSFDVMSVRRMAKVEDEDAEFMNEIGGIDSSTSEISLPQQTHSTSAPNRPSRASSVRSYDSSVPRGVRVHRASWSTADFAEHNYGGLERTSPSMMDTRESNRPGGGISPSVHARPTSSNDDIRRHSPKPTGQSNTIPLPSRVRSLSSTSSSQRSTNWRLSESPNGQRPPLQTVYSTNEISPIPNIP
ncbi:TRP-domain-containing protein [Periconia macrospinosa]|uniref:TRP-domain-containing protein n=1 Tax=Periconia macrospinosa TaxID=97972 RepID=A0A2V1DPL7_9PLEO|nr:TRP-domain-containing protein [Periconia macrospinosa]